mgnify:FL=1
MTYSIERVKYPDGTIAIRHADWDGEWWREWVVAPTEDIALDHIDPEYYGGPGRGFARCCRRLGRREEMCHG